VHVKSRYATDCDREFPVNEASLDGFVLRLDGSKRRVVVLTDILGVVDLHPVLVHDPEVSVRGYRPDVPVAATGHPGPAGRPT
jgi:hypothetical protein